MLGILRSTSGACPVTMSRRTIPTNLEASRSRCSSEQSREVVVLLLDQLANQLGATTVSMQKETQRRIRTIHGSARNCVGAWLKNQGWFWASLADTNHPFILPNSNGHPLFQAVAKARPVGQSGDSIASCLVVSIEPPQTETGLKTTLAVFGSTTRLWTKDDLECVESYAAAINAHESLRAEVERLKTERNEFATLENRWRQLTEQTLDLVTRQGPDGRISKVSILQEPVLGHTATDLVGKRLNDFVHPDDQKRFRERFEAIVEGRESSRISYRFRRRDGAYVWLETSVVAVYDPFTGGLSEVICGSRDVTDRVSTTQLTTERNLIDRLKSRGPGDLLVDPHPSESTQRI